MSESQSIFITGTSSGFGRAAALQMAQRGHTVFATMRVPVGEDSKMACTPINEAQEQSQSAIMSHFGWN